MSLVNTLRGDDFGTADIGNKLQLIYKTKYNKLRDDGHGQYFKGWLLWNCRYWKQTTDRVEDEAKLRK